MRKKKFKLWQVVHTVLAGLVLMGLAGCDQEVKPSNEAHTLLQRIGAFMETPRSDDVKKLFAGYTSLATGLADATPSRRTSYLQDAYTRERESKGVENVPAPIWGAMNGTANAGLLKSYFAAVPDSPWNPKNLREATTIAVEPWGWLARSKGSAPLWLTFAKPTKIQGAELRLVAVSTTEQEARQAGDGFAAWQQRLHEQFEKEIKEEKERTAKAAEEEKLREVKAQCAYNVREIYLKQLVLSDASVEMVEENDDLYARVRFKIKNASTSPMSQAGFALIIYNDEGNSTIINKYTSSDTLAPGIAYWRTLDMRSYGEVMAAQAVKDEGYTVELLPLSFKGGDSPMPDNETIMAALQQKDGGWIYKDQPVSAEVSPRILEKYRSTASFWDVEKNKGKLTKIQEKARNDAATLLAGVRLSGRVLPQLDNGRVLMDVSVTNGTDKTLEGLEMKMDFTEDGAVVDGLTADSWQKIAPGQTTVVRFNSSEAWLKRLHPALLSNKAGMTITLKEARFGGKRIDADGQALLPRVFRNN